MRFRQRQQKFFLLFCCRITWSWSQTALDHTLWRLLSWAVRHQAGSWFHGDVQRQQLARLCTVNWLRGCVTYVLQFTFYQHFSACFELLTSTCEVLPRPASPAISPRSDYPYKYKVKARRPRLLLGWVTAKESRALWTWVRSSVWTLNCDRPS
jgi:hypothetical protein